MECVEFFICFGNFRNLLRRVRNYYVVVYKDVGDIFVNVFEDGGVYGDVGDEMVIYDVYMMVYCEYVWI